MAGIGSVKRSAQALREHQAEDNRQRKAAATILNANEVSGDYDAGRMLQTTLGGKPRDITNDDLAAFRQNIKTAERRFKGGINVRQVVDLSTNEDRKRTRTQINTAVAAASRPTKAGALEVRFMTNAGPGSKHSRHQVMVEFLSFDQLVADGRYTSQRAAVRLRQAGIRFDCDCEHHRYRLRYIATIGGYNAGRSETGFPKITNPGLSGVACKHVLRVMAEVEGGNAVQLFLTKAIEKVRAGKTGRQQTAQREADRQADKQSQRNMAANAQGAGDRDLDRSRRALRKQSRATTTKPNKTANGSKKAQSLAKMNTADGDAAFKRIVAEMGVDRAEELIAGMRNAKK